MVSSSPNAGNANAAKISGAVSGGAERLYFLPPIAAAETFRGFFDPTLDPVVRITGPGIDARFTTSSGSGSEVVRVDDTVQCYLFNWRTSKFPVVSGSVYRIAVSVGGRELGYAEAIAGFSPKVLPKTGSSYVFLKIGRTLPVKFRIEQPLTYSVKPGIPQTITTPENKIIVEVPAGAVTAEVDITIAPIADQSTMPDNAVAGTTYDFGPDGLVFSEQVTLTIAYDPSLLPVGITEGSLVMWHQANGAAWQAIPGSTVDEANNSVSAPVTGFSNYSIAPLAPHKIVFTRTPSGGWGGGGPQGEIWVMNSDGTGQTNISNDPLVHDHTPSFSPIDNRVLFIKNKQVCIMNDDGTNLVTLNIAGECPGIAQSAAWSPDGARVVYQNSYCDSSLHIVTIATGADIMLPYSCSSGPFSWSPDGMKIAFTGSGWCAPSELATVLADGSAAPRLLTATGSWVTGAAWSPDNLWIACEYNGAILLVAPDGTQQKNISGGGGAVHDCHPAWSPDGSQLLFSRFSGSSNIYVVNIASGVVTALTSGTTYNDNPAWWSDGSRILFRSHRDGNWEICSMNPDGSDVVNLTNTNDDEWLSEF